MWLRLFLNIFENITRTNLIPGHQSYNLNINFFDHIYCRFLRAICSKSLRENIWEINFQMQITN